MIKVPTDSGEHMDADIIFWEAPEPDPLKVRIKTTIKVAGEPVFAGFISYNRADWETQESYFRQIALENASQAFLKSVVEVESVVMEELVSISKAEKRLRGSLELIREDVQAQMDVLTDPECWECDPEFEAPDVTFLHGMLGFLDAALDALPVEEEEEWDPEAEYEGVKEWEKCPEF